MPANPPPTSQRGVASDPRHGKARGEVIEGKSGATFLRQVVMVVVTLGSVVGVFLMLGVLLTEDPSRPTWVDHLVYGLIGLAAVLASFALVSRRRSRRDLEQALRSRRGG